MVQHKPNTRLEICKAFQDRLTFLNRHMVVQIGQNLSILRNLLRIQDCWPFSVLKTLTGYRSYSHSEKDKPDKRIFEVYQKFFPRSNKKVDEGEAVQNQRMEADLDGEVENEMKKITYYFYCIHSDCTVCFITEDFLYCV